MGVAKPLLVADEAYAVAIAGPAYRMETRLDRHLEKLAAACRAIADQLISASSEPTS